MIIKHKLSDVADLMKANPESNVIMNHVGGMLGIQPHDGKRDEVFKIWSASILEIAQFPNHNIKVGGLGILYCGFDFHLRDKPPSSEELAKGWRPYVETCIEAFGPTRCLMESNFPVDKQSCSYGVLWNALKRITKSFTAVITRMPPKTYISQWNSWSSAAPAKMKSARIRSAPRMPQKRTRC